MVFPSMMLSMSGDMLHMDLMDTKWHLTLWGFVQGLLGWFIAAGVGGWLIAAMYNRFI
tara:strand:+ start:10415 stop:10588 length:174 start_codon:yes stop_codon:yes gene_type:complete